MLIRYTAYDLNNSLNVAVKISDITTGTPGVASTFAMANWLNGTYYYNFTPTPGHSYIMNAMVYTDGTFTTPLDGPGNYAPADFSYSPSGEFPKNLAKNGFSFVMKDASGNPVTGLTVTAKRTIDGGALAACTNPVTEVGDGFYTINLSAADLNGGIIGLEFSASGAATTQAVLVTT